MYLFGAASLTVLFGFIGNADEPNTEKSIQEKVEEPNAVESIREKVLCFIRDKVRCFLIFFY